MVDSLRVLSSSDIVQKALPYRASCIIKLQEHLNPKDPQSIFRFVKIGSTIVILLKITRGEENIKEKGTTCTTRQKCALFSNLFVTSLFFISNY